MTLVLIRMIEEAAEGNRFPYGFAIPLSTESSHTGSGRSKANLG